MKYHLVLLCLAIVFTLFCINTAYSVNLSATYDDDETKTVYIVKQVLKLSCNSSDEVATIRWEKNGQDLANNSDIAKRFETKFDQSGKVYTMSTNMANDDDAGEYSCTALDNNHLQLARADIKVASQVHVKVPTNLNVVEGEKLKIECQTVGRPHVHWTYSPEGMPAKNYSNVMTQGRITLRADESKINNTILEIIEVQMSDRGNYTCWGQALGGNRKDTSSCIIRVKSRYAALWPFLGICAEVFVLCLIIFIYEKKRNKTELEESDTDQSPDQKNTPDHGKDSNLRHRQ